MIGIIKKRSCFRFRDLYILYLYDNTRSQVALKIVTDRNTWLKCRGHRGQSLRQGWF